MIVSAGKPDKDQRVDIENYNFHFDCFATKVWILSYENCILLPSLNVLKQKKTKYDIICQVSLCVKVPLHNKYLCLIGMLQCTRCAFSSPDKFIRNIIETSQFQVLLLSPDLRQKFSLLCHVK